MHSLLQYIHNLQDSSYFFSVFLGTIIATRIFLLPQKRIISPKVRGAHVHHYIYGLILILIATILPSVTLYAMGLGLFVDELPVFGIESFLFSDEEWHWDEYDSPKSLTILLFGIFLVYMFRFQLLLLLPHSALL